MQTLQTKFCSGGSQSSTMTTPSSQGMDQGNNSLLDLAPQEFTCLFIKNASENKEYCLQLFVFAEKQNIFWNGLHLSL